MKGAVVDLTAVEWLSQIRGVNTRLNALTEADENDNSIQTLKQMRAEVLSVIALVKDHVLATLLIERYVNSKKWEDVADSIHYSFSHTTKTLHPKALQEISRILSLDHNEMQVP